MKELTEQQIRAIVKFVSVNAEIKQQYLYCFRTKKLTMLGFILVLHFLTKCTDYFIANYTRFTNE